MNKTDRFSSFGSNSLPKGKICNALPLIKLEGFEDPEDHALMTLGVDADFINPDAEIITIESQQIDEDIKKKVFQTVVNFKPTLPGIFLLNKAAIAASNAPEKTIFIINENDLNSLGDEANVARNVITMLKDQKVGIFTNIAEAKEFVNKQLNESVFISNKPSNDETIDVDKLKEII